MIIKIPDKNDHFLQHSSKKFDEQEFNFIVLTENGKPVFCSFGDEYEIASKIATFSIILNKLEISWDEKDEPLYFKNSQKTFIFANRNSLRYVLISLQNMPIYFLQILMEILIKLFIMQISLHYEKILQKKSNYDLLANINIEKKLMVNIQFNIQKFIPIFFQSYVTFSVDPSIRQKIKKCIQKNSNNDILYTLVIGNSGLITYNTNFDIILSADEINLLILMFNQKIDQVGQIAHANICLQCKLISYQSQWNVQCLLQIYYLKIIFDFCNCLLKQFN